MKRKVCRKIQSNQLKCGIKYATIVTKGLKHFGFSITDCSLSHQRLVYKKSFGFSILVYFVYDVG